VVNDENELLEEHRKSFRETIAILYRSERAKESHDLSYGVVMLQPNASFC
jgi:hypothetical protein